MDNLFEQMTNITKAHGYDILAKQNTELKERIVVLEKALKDINATFYESIRTDICAVKMLTISEDALKR